MKQIIILLLGLTIRAQAQQAFSKDALIAPYKLQVTANKTTNLVFPSAIISIDRGSQGIFVQKAEGVENILRVKADSAGIAETNLSVITTDGKFYSFVVNYVDSPAYLNVSLGKTVAEKPTSVKDSIVYAQPFLEKAGLEAIASFVLHTRNNTRKLEDESGHVSLSVNGFYVRGNTFFCKLLFENGSGINYDIEQLRFYIRDKKQSKRTSSQEVDVGQLFVLGNISTIEGKTASKVVVALPKFTIPDGKYLIVEVIEKNGGRNLSIEVGNKKIIKAKRV